MTCNNMSNNNDYELLTTKIYAFPKYILLCLHKCISQIRIYLIVHVLFFSFLFLTHENIGGYRNFHAYNSQLNNFFCHVNYVKLCYIRYYQILSFRIYS